MYISQETFDKSLIYMIIGNVVSLCFYTYYTRRYCILKNKRDLLAEICQTCMPSDTFNVIKLNTYKMFIILALLLLDFANSLSLFTVIYYKTELIMFSIFLSVFNVFLNIFIIMTFYYRVLLLVESLACLHHKKNITKISMSYYCLSYLTLLLIIISMIYVNKELN